MTTPSDPSAAAPGADERRLHPLSWLFVLLASLREFALPLLAVLLFGRGGGDTWELLGLLGGAGLALHAVAQYFTYRYRLLDDALVIRSGLLHRQLRHVPFARIHNVSLRRNVLHRLAGVAEVVLESAGGGHTPEARMRVLRLDDAQALEALVRTGGRAETGATDTTDDTAPDTPPRLALSTAEVVKAGLISNRGMVVLAATLGALAQSGSGALSRLVDLSTGPVVAWSRAQVGGDLGWVLGAALSFLLFLVLLRLLSVALALLHLHGFTLREQAGRLQIDSGLLTRVRANLPLRRVQLFRVEETLLHRAFGRQRLTVDSAATQQTDGSQQRRDLVPIAPPPTLDGLLRDWLPGGAGRALDWQPVHPRAWRRLWLGPSVALLALTAVGVWRLGPAALGLLALWPLLLLRARREAASLRWAFDGRVVAVRGGWLGHRWLLADVAKLQSLRWEQSPFDRRHGMAHLLLDTAGTHAMDPPLRLRYLPEATARALATRLGHAIARSRLRW